MHGEWCTPHCLTTVQFTEKRQTISTDLVTVNTECPSCCSVVRPSVCRTIEWEREPNTQINTTDVPRSHTTHNRHVWMTPHVSECRGRGEGAVISLSHYPLYVCVYTMKACIHVDTTSADHAALFVSLRLSVRYTQVNQRHPGEIADLCSVPCSRTKTRTRQPGNTARRIHTLITATRAIFILWKGRHLKWRVIIYSAFYRYGDPINSVRGHMI